MTSFSFITCLIRELFDKSINSLSFTLIKLELNRSKYFFSFSTIKISNKFAESIETLLIRKASENWHEMYGKLLQFVEDNGHARVRIDDPILGTWTDTQRQNYRKTGFYPRRHKYSY